MKVASYALPSSAIIFFFIVVADLRGLFTNKCMMYTNITLVVAHLKVNLLYLTLIMILNHIK